MHQNAAEAATVIVDGLPPVLIAVARALIQSDGLMVAFTPDCVVLSIVASSSHCVPVVPDEVPPCNCTVPDVPEENVPVIMKFL